MLSLVGTVCVLTGSVALGVSAVKRLDSRVTALRSLIEALELLERELDFSLPPMREMITETARRAPEPAAAFLFACVKKMDEQEGHSLAELWKQATQENLSTLKACDQELLMTVGAVLGRYDAESQRKTICATRNRLSGNLAEAENERHRQGRVYGTLGAAVGAFLVIILL